MVVEAIPEGLNTLVFDEEETDDDVEMVSLQRRRKYTNPIFHSKK